MVRILSFFILFIVTSKVAFASSDEIKLISLYPVPCKSSQIFVKVNFSGSTLRKVELRNLIGKKIEEKAFPSGADYISFDEMDSNPNGVYVIIAKDANGKVLEISKFILNL